MLSYAAAQVQRRFKKLTFQLRRAAERPHDPDAVYDCARPRVASCRARKLLANSSTGKKLGTPVESFKSADGERAYRLFSK
jgi:hypothetical protein